MVLESSMADFLYSSVLLLLFSIFNFRHIHVCLCAHTWTEKSVNILSDLRGICWQKADYVYVLEKFTFSVFGNV